MAPLAPFSQGGASHARGFFPKGRDEDLATCLGQFPHRVERGADQLLLRECLVRVGASCLDVRLFGQLPPPRTFSPTRAALPSRNRSGPRATEVGSDGIDVHGPQNEAASASMCES